MARIEIDLNTRSYAVACEDGQEARLREVAAFTDSKLRALVAGKPNGCSEVQSLVLTCLTLADQIFDLRAELAKARAAGSSAAAASPQMDEATEARYAALIESLAERVNTVASRLARA